MILARKEGALGPEWDQVLTHKPVSLENSPQEIVDYLLSGQMPECSACPERHESVEARQLSMEEVRRICNPAFSTSGGGFPVRLPVMALGRQT